MNKIKSALKIILAVTLLEACALTSPRNGANAPAPPSATSLLPPAANTAPTTPSSTSDLTTARAKIKHIIIIMQENRSFDEYFGTYPGADGIPMLNGVPTVCVNDPKLNQCVKPYHDPSTVNAGGPHAAVAASADIDGGKMDGFISSFPNWQKACISPNAPRLALGKLPA